MVLISSGPQIILASFLWREFQNFFVNMELMVSIHTTRAKKKKCVACRMHWLPINIDSKSHALPHKRPHVIQMRIRASRHCWHSLLLLNFTEALCWNCYSMNIKLIILCYLIEIVFVIPSYNGYLVLSMRQSIL